MPFWSHCTCATARGTSSGPPAALPADVTCLYDLRTNPIACSISAFHSLHFYRPRRALDAVADLDEVVRIDDLDCREPGIGVNDRIIRQLGLTLLPAFDRPDRVAAIFVDHVTVAIAAHVARAYRSGHAPSRRAPGGLAPRQELRAKEMLDANLDGDVPIEHLAKECGVPLGDFARAFRESTGMAPHQWLLRARIDKAKNLLHCSGLSQTEVARACGFADEGHFIRVLPATARAPAPGGAASVPKGSRAQAPQARTIPRSSRSGS